MKPGSVIILFLFFLLNGIFLTTNATKRFVREGYTGTGEFVWNNASGNLFNIMSISLPGDTVWVAKGTYKPTTGTDRTLSFFLKPGVVLQGGFAGYETFLTQRSITANPTILSGDIDTVGNNDTYHVLSKSFQYPLLTAATVLDGFIIEKGRADEPGLGVNSRGGAMYLENSSPTISNCRFISNYSLTQGGTLYLSGGSPSFSDCEFSLNDGGVAGGAFYLTGTGDVSIYRCNFNNNNSDMSSVLFAEELVQVTISLSIFKDNHTQFLSALYLNTNFPIQHRIDNCLFINNFIEAPFDQSDPTTIFSENTGLTVINCNFYNPASSPDSGNFAIDGGGNYFNCIFSGNNHLIRSSNYLGVYNAIIEGGDPVCQNCPGGNGNVNPLFTNINDLDGPDNVLGTADDGMRLSAYSAGIDAGLDSLFGGLDITGAFRSIGIDIGAYENGVCTGTPSSRLYVDSSVKEGNGKGDSWQNAIADLKLALNVASSCSGVNEIWVAKGTYKPTTTSDRNRYFSMLNGVSIYGGFQGNETALSQRNHRKYIATLSGDIDKAGTADSYNIIHNNDLNNTALLDGFTVTGANNESSDTISLGWVGAAIYNKQSSPVFKNCVIKNNNAGFTSGGGMSNYKNSSPVVLNCVFANNQARSGGGVFNTSASSPVLRNCVLVNNSCPINGGGMASGAFSNPTLINCNIIGNTAGQDGAGIYNLLSSSPVITNCLFWGNGGLGKEIFNNESSSVPVVSYSYIQGGYTPCTSCANNSIAPQFLKDFNWAGADSVYGTVDDEMHLNEASPCLNSGNNAVVVDSFDVAGQPRIQNGTVNIGAYENMYLITLTSGNWHNPFIWNYQRVPSATDHVYIKTTHVIQLNQPGAACKSLLVQPSAKLQIVLPGDLKVQ